MKLLEYGTRCEYPGCDESADYTVYSRNKDEVLFCCHKHARQVLGEGRPEYQVTCENCGCRLPIG